MIELNVGPEDAGQRLDKYLKRSMPDIPGSLLYKQLRKKNITLNKLKSNGTELVKNGDRIQLFFSQETYDKFCGRENTINVSPYLRAYNTIGNLQILYEDDNILAVNKPLGLLTQRASDGDISLNEWLIGYLLSTGHIDATSIRHYKPSAMNRLDRNTTGLVLCAKSYAGSRVLAELIRDRSVRKFYHTIVKGRVDHEERLIAYLSKDETDNRVDIQPEGSPLINDDYSRVETRIIPVRRLMGAFLPECTYIEVELITGKSHQIRAHLAHIGHPLLGDHKYGDRNVNSVLSKHYNIESQLLHAARVEFPDDATELPGLGGLIIECKDPEIYGNLEK